MGVGVRRIVHVIAVRSFGFLKLDRLCSHAKGIVLDGLGPTHANWKVNPSYVVSNEKERA